MATICTLRGRRVSGYCQGDNVVILAVGILIRRPNTRPGHPTKHGELPSIIKPRIVLSNRHGINFQPPPPAQLKHARLYLHWRHFAKWICPARGVGNVIYISINNQFAPSHPPPEFIAMIYRGAGLKVMVALSPVCSTPVPASKTVPL